MMAETNNSAPLTKTARQQKIIDLITRQSVRSQIELAEALATQGITVTQATLSRDLAEVGAVKIRSTTGSVYAVPGEGGDRSLQQSTGDSLDAKLPRILEELLVSASPRTTRSCCAPRREPHSTGLGDRPVVDGRDLRHPGRRTTPCSSSPMPQSGSGPGRDLPRVCRRWAGRGVSLCRWDLEPGAPPRWGIHGTDGRLGEGKLEQ